MPRVATDLFRFPAAARHDPAIDTWLDAQVPELGAIARTWFTRLRESGGDVRELMHEGAAQKRLLAKLGKHRMAKASLYVRRLADIDFEVLRQLIIGSIAEVGKRFG